MTHTSSDPIPELHSTEPIPTTVQRAVIAVCRDAFHFRDDVRALFVSAGVPVALYDKYNEPLNSKAKIARSVLTELQATGAPGYAIQRRLIEDLCCMSKPDSNAPDQKAGQSALAELKREATSRGVLITAEKLATHQRRAADQRRTWAVADRQERLGKLHTEFLTLHRLDHMTPAQRQGRGYRLERLMADLFRLHDIDYRPSYKTDREQIDGSFHFRGFTYLVENKWRAQPPAAGELHDFKAKVDGKIDSTRGIFVSMAGYKDEVVEHVFRTPRTSRNNIILFDGRDVALLFEGAIGLVDALTTKIDAAEQEGEFLHPLFS